MSRVRTFRKLRRWPGALVAVLLLVGVAPLRVGAQTSLEAGSVPTI